MNAKSSVFVTGATGFIGRYLTRNLLDRGLTVYALVRTTSQSSRREVIQNLKDHAETTQGKISFITGDLAQSIVGSAG